jgi:HPt (histidine-containing phosphotransfer) domain-containing protein
MKRDEQIWDKYSALERFGGDEEFLRELCQIFLQDSPGLLARLREGVQKGDAKQIMHAAHSLTGELVYLAASPALGAARQLEGMGSRGDLVLAADALATLEKEIANLHLCLRDCIWEFP